MTHDKLPRAAEIEAMIDSMLEQRPPLSDVCHVTVAQLNALKNFIAAHLRQREDVEQRKSEPVAWRIKNFAPYLNGGFAWSYTADDKSVTSDHEPLYTAPPSTDAEDARRYRWLRDIGLDENGWHLSQELGNGMEEMHLFPDRIDEAINAAMQGESHEH